MLGNLVPSTIFRGFVRNLEGLRGMQMSTDLRFSILTVFPDLPLEPRPLHWKLAKLKTYFLIDAVTGQWSDLTYI